MKYDFDEIVDRSTTGAEKYAELEKLYGNPGAIPLWVADMDFKAAQPILDAVRERMENGIFGYTVRPEKYYDTVCSFQKRRKNWDMDEKLMSVSLGVVPAICMLISELTAPGDRIIIQTPVYRPFYNAVRDAGRELLESPLLEEDGYFSMDFEDIEEKARQGARYMILCSPHNPVGRVWTKEELKTLGDICVRYGIRVISDEIHSDLVLWGNRHIPFAAVSEEVRKLTVTCISATKTFNLAGLQNSITVFPDTETKNIFDRAWARLHIECGNCFSLVGTQAAFEHGEEWLEQLITYIEGNVKLVMDYLHRFLPEIKPVRPEATYLVWLDCRQLGMTGRQLTDFMVNKAGVAMSAGTYFGKNAEGYMRMNVACPRAVVQKALQQLKEAVKTLDG